MGNSIIKSKLTLQKRECHYRNFNYNSEYCPNYGQQFLEGRFTMNESIGWFFNKLLNIEKGLFFTIKELTVNTHEILSKYFKKATTSYMHLFRFAFLMATVSAILIVFSGTFDSSLIMQFSGGIVEGWNGYEVEGQANTSEIVLAIEILETIKKYFAFILLFNIPLYAVASFLIYYKRRLNFTEHLILNCYALSFTLFVGIPLNLLMLWNDGLFIYSILNPIITVSSYAFIYKRFSEENYFMSLLKTVLLLISIVIIIGVIVLASIIIKQQLKG